MIWKCQEAAGAVGRENEMNCCETCILYQFCTYDRTGICEAKNFKDVIPDKCKFCELRWECPVDRGGECIVSEEKA